MATDAPLDPSLSLSHPASHPAGPALYAETLSPLEQEVLDEYARLLGNLNTMSTLLQDLSANPSAEILDALRGLKRKTSLVLTLLKASVYIIVLNTQIREDGGEESVCGEGL